MPCASRIPLVGVEGTINGEQSQLSVAASGLLTNPEAFESVILRASADGEAIRLRDVARVEMSASRTDLPRSMAGQRALISVTSWPGQVAADKLLNNYIVGRLPPEMSLSCLADRSADQLLSVEVRLPGGSTLERTMEVVVKTTEQIRGLSGESTVFAFGEEREPNTAMIFIKANSEGLTVTDLDKALIETSEAIIRVGDVPPGEAAFPARMALLDLADFGGPAEQGEKGFREVAGCSWQLVE